MFKSVIDEMTYGTEFKLVHLFHVDNRNLTHQDLNTSVHEPDNLWNIHLLSYNTSSSRARPSGNGQLPYCVRSFGIFVVSHQYKTMNSVGWQSAMKVKIEFKLQVTATPGFHSLYDLHYQATWLFSCAPENPEDNTVMK